MAKPVKLGKGKEFSFKSATRGGAPKYPWDEWLTGELLLLEQDHTGPDGKVSKRDYDVETKFMPSKLKAAARKRYKVVQVSLLDADGKRLKDSLIIRARDMTEEERAAEDIRRAEEKEELLEKRRDKKAAKARAAAAAPAPSGPTLAQDTSHNVAI